MAKTVVVFPPFQHPWNLDTVDMVGASSPCLGRSAPECLDDVKESVRPSALISNVICDIEISVHF